MQRDETEFKQSSHQQDTQPKETKVVRAIDWGLSKKMTRAFH
jgi:hypothetical protein